LKRKVHDSFSDKLLGKQITLRGIAFDSKAGAVLKLKDGIIVYIYDLASWTDEFLRQQICVTGLLQKKKIIPDVTIDENGAISQGAPGDQYLLDQVKDIKRAS
jgi:hypothetical protein